jgi:hypothetical protein
MDKVKELLPYWPVLAGVVALAYFVVKMAIRTAVLEVMEIIRNGFVTTSFCETCRAGLSKRIDHLENEVTEHHDKEDIINAINNSTKGKKK